MTKSILSAVLLSTTLSGCGWYFRPESGAAAGTGSRH